MTAAHFPIPRFNAMGSPVSSDGVVIYEGMKFTVDSSTGYYEVSFTATAPNIPVLVRLQLELTQSSTLSALTPKQSIILTLPPIMINPTREARAGDPLGTTVAINHRGYSAALNGNRTTTMVFPTSTTFEKPEHSYLDIENMRKTGTKPVAYANENWIVTRKGTARFGLNAPTSDEYSH